MKLVTVEQMRAIEKEADARGLTYARMMENAGRALADSVLHPAFARRGTTIIGLVGPGNNGGDTLIALTHLASAGWSATAYLVKRSQDVLVRALASAGGEIQELSRDPDGAILTRQLKTTDMVFDGILGTGIRLSLKDEVSLALTRAGRLLAESAARPLVIAVDCPSGVDCDTGEAAPETLRADLTITMAAVKEGLLKLPAHDLVGDLQVADIGLPTDLPSLTSLNTEVATASLVSSLMPKRASDSHKGTFGTALIAAGSVNYTGAALLAGRAAYRVGAGLVTMAVPAPLHGAVAGHFPEGTWVLLPHELGVIARQAAHVLAESLVRATALLIGPGLGGEQTTRELMQEFLTTAASPRRETAAMGFVGSRRGKVESGGRSMPPLIVDADGLRILSQMPDWDAMIPAGSVLTPHPGEMSALTGLGVEEIQANRREVALKFARQWQQVVALKGAFTVVAAPDGLATIIPVASSALAKGGTGDVLAGAIVGLRAQGLGGYEAAVAGAWLHGRAGLAAARRLGASGPVLAGDVCEALSEAVGEIT